MQFQGELNLLLSSIMYCAVPLLPCNLSNTEMHSWQTCFIRSIPLVRQKRMCSITLTWGINAFYCWRMISFLQVTITNFKIGHSTLTIKADSLSLPYCISVNTPIFVSTSIRYSGSPAVTARRQYVTGVKSEKETTSTCCYDNRSQWLQGTKATVVSPTLALPGWGKKGTIGTSSVSAWRKYTK